MEANISKALSGTLLRTVDILHRWCNLNVSNVKMSSFVPQCFCALAFFGGFTKVSISLNQTISLVPGAKTRCRPLTRSTTCPGHHTAQTH